jgi:hypothetical protein
MFAELRAHLITSDFIYPTFLSMPLAATKLFDIKPKAHCLLVTYHHHHQRGQCDLNYYRYLIMDPRQHHSSNPCQKLTAYSD